MTAKRVFAVATWLNPVADRETQTLWQWLETDCGLKGIRLTPTPHVSWQGAETYDQEEVKRALEKLAAESRPFKVSTSGLGLFTGQYPVLYLPVIKTRELLDYHERIWNLVHPFAINPNPHYTPDRWQPHVTLGYDDLTPDNLGCAVGGMMHKNLNLDILIDHVVLIYAIGEELGTVARYNFQQKEK